MRVVLWGYTGVAEDFAVLNYDTVSRDYQILTFLGHAVSWSSRVEISYYFMTFRILKLKTLPYPEAS